MFKKLKGNKGFTLIELIVVIAILAILMLLIAPKFLGFTENARISADKAAASTLEKSIQTLVATSELNNKSAAVTIAITAAGAWTVTGSLFDQDAATALTSAEVESKVENLSGNIELQSSNYTSLSTTVTSAGGVTVALLP